MGTRLWVDANVIVRHVTGDPPDMARRATDLMRRADRGEITLVVAEIVVAEAFWVLRSFYGHPSRQVAEVLIDFLRAPGIRAVGRQRLLQALELVQRQGVDIADALLAVQAARAGEKVCSFDLDFQRLPVEWEPP
ncbi:tRNA(fMet)-specific endonuclease VapC [bacterium HR11]|nr:tRNA(fMet)-specific endonuclease VapC [bacterium HR11]